MSRYRPPQRRGSAYITPAGWQQLRGELDRLWNERRPQVVQALADAAAEGDRSENAEYIYRKKELREIDRRAGYLSRRVEELTVVDTTPDDVSRVFFGARVTLADPAGKQHRYRIVGPDETHAAAGAISIDSPMARALIGKSAGDCVAIPLPDGSAEFELLAVDYA